MKLLLLAIISLGFSCALFCSQEVKIPLGNRCMTLPLKDQKMNDLLARLQNSQDLSRLSDAVDEAFCRCTSLARQQEVTQELTFLISRTSPDIIRDITLQEIKQKERRWMSAPLYAAAGAIILFSLPVGAASLFMLTGPCHP